MPPTIEWTDVAVRLFLTVVACGIIGINRTERGRPAGLRTTILVGLAAAVAMIQTNLLLSTGGKRSDSFAQFDVMRLPLGILTGMGFIGAGAIIRRGPLVTGVTTAATMWLVTVVGLCFGGGQLGLGGAGTAVAITVLWGLKQLELRLPQDRQGQLTLEADRGAPENHELQALLLRSGCWISSWSVERQPGEPAKCHIHCELHWHARTAEFHSPPFLEQLRERPGLLIRYWETR